MDDKEFKFEEFKIIIGIGKDYFGFYFRAVILFFAVMGVLFKLFIDSAPHSSERLIIFIGGLCISTGSIIGTLCVRSKYNLVKNRCKTLSAELNIPDVYFPGTTRTAKGFFVGLLMISFFWVMLLFTI